MVHRFEARQWVPFPVELVFAFFANPANLPHLMPRRLKMRIEEAHLKPPPPRPVASDATRRFRSVAAGPGSEILISFRPIPLLPFRAHWAAEITQLVWNSHIVDEQISGPFARFRHRHGIEAEVVEGAEGTAVTDEIEYELPASALGAIADPFIRAALKSTFAERQKRLPELLSAAAEQAAKRPL
jgi:ligand-binding SRPBCC domain-containing protein